MMKLSLSHGRVQVLFPDGDVSELPVKCVPAWTKAMGARLARARKLLCPRVNRKDRHWMHEGSDYAGIYGKCLCIGQHELSRQLGVSQSFIAKLEAGKIHQGAVTLEQLYAVFGEITWYILIGRGKKDAERKVR